MASTDPGSEILPTLTGTTTTFPEHHQMAKEPPQEQPVAVQEPQDPSLSEHITCLLARQAWVPFKLPLNTPAVTKDSYEFAAEDQQVAMDRYISMLAKDLTGSELAGLLEFTFREFPRQVIMILATF